MNTFNRQDREDAVKQVLASWALEGWKPDAEYSALLNRYIEGDLTLDELDAHIDAKFGINTKSSSSKSSSPGAAAIPENKLWLHEPQVKRDLQEAIAWAESHPAQESDLETMLKKLNQSRDG